MARSRLVDRTLLRPKYKKLLGPHFSPAICVITRRDGSRYGHVNYKNKPAFIVWHHGAGKLTSNMKKYDRMHRRDRGWACVGYHYGILPDGTIEVGRYERMNGSHAPGLNGRSIGICLIGNFEKAPPTAAQLNSACLLSAELCQRYKWPVTRNIRHKDVYRRFWNPRHKRKRYTKCPGKLFPLGIIRRRAQVILDSGVALSMEEI